MRSGAATQPSFGDIFKYVATWFLVFVLLTILSVIQRRMDSLQQQAKKPSEKVAASKAISASRIPTGKTVFLQNIAHSITANRIPVPPASLTA